MGRKMNEQENELLNNVMAIVRANAKDLYYEVTRSDEYDLLVKSLKKKDDQIKNLKGGSSVLL